MNTYETHIGWLKIPMRPDLSPTERNFDTRFRVAWGAITATVRQTTGVSIARSGPEGESIIRPPEDGWSWYYVNATKVPAMGMAALRQIIGGAYQDVFTPGCPLREEPGVPPTLVDTYATALEVVPQGWITRDSPWIPEAYRPTA